MSNEATAIHRQDDLEAFCAALAPHDFLVIDTEFHRETTYYPQLCLVQAAAPGVEGMIDALADGLDMTPFWDLVADPNRLKVMHAARQDMEIFNKIIGHPPTPLFDSQIAAMALGLGDSIAYDKLVAQVTGGRIDKSSQFTDWTRRPLSAKQLDYALGDVTHLREVYLEMKAKLEALGRTEWVASEIEAMTDPALYAADPEDAWKRLKIRRPRKDYLAVLKTVAAWRERTAQELDRPRNRVLKDDGIQEIADQRPTQASGLDRLRAVPKGFGNSRHAKGLMEAVNLALDDVDAHAPQVEKHGPHKPAPPGATDLLRVLLKQVCDDAEVTPRLVANAADLERIAAGDGNETDVMKGWRFELFGSKAGDLLNGRLAMTFDNGDVRLFPVPYRTVT